MYHDYKKSGIIHKIVQNKVKNILHENISALHITEFIESEIKNLTKYQKENPLNSGIAFPVGINVNDVAAHFSPSKSCDFKISNDDLVKIDFGVHINGCITDGAFSWCPTGKYNKLIDIAEEAVNIGIKNSGIDANLGDIGAEIEEYINNTDIEIDNKLISVNQIRDLCGHKIEPYKIHAGKAVPNIKINYNKRMELNEVYAIETYPTLGNGISYEDNICNHYMLKTFDIHNIQNNNIKEIYNNRLTMPFCPRWFDFDNNLYDNINIIKYPLIKTKDKNIVSQYEKTIFLYENKVEILN